MTVAAVLTVLALGITHAPAAPAGCTYTMGAISTSPPPVMAGNLRTTDGGCIVWINARFLSALRRRDVCQLAAHEAGHLGGLHHSLDPLNVMYSPFTPLRRSFC